MGDLSPWHLLIIAIVLVLLFGSRKLPGAAKSIGQSLKIFKDETKGLRGDDNDVPHPAVAPAPVAAPLPAQPPLAAQPPVVGQPPVVAPQPVAAQPVAPQPVGSQPSAPPTPQQFPPRA